MIMKGYFMKSSIALMVLSAALASCTQDEIVQNDVPARQALNISVNTQDFVSEDGSRATTGTNENRTTAFVKGDEMGMYVISDDGTVICNNEKFVYDGKAWNAENELYYWKNANYIAYYPYNADLTAQNIATVDAIKTKFAESDDFYTQNTAEAYEKADLMLAEIQKPTDGELEFNLAHQFSMVEINVPVRKYVTTDDYHYTAPVGMADDSTIKIGESDVKPYMAGKGTFRFIVPSGEVSLTLDGRLVYDENVPVYFGKSEAESINLEANSCKVYNVTYNKISETEVERDIEVGDYYYADGSIYPYGNQDENDCPDPVKNGCIGIVFSTTGVNDTDGVNTWNHGYVLSFKNTPDVGMWSADATVTLGENYYVAGTDFTTEGSVEARNAFLDLKNGYLVTQELIKQENAFAAHEAVAYGDTYPEFSAPEGLSSGWYLPSVGQIYAMLDNLGELDFTTDKQQAHLFLDKDGSRDRAAKEAARDKVIEKIQKINADYTLKDSRVWLCNEGANDKAWAIQWFDNWVGFHTDDKTISNNNQKIVRPILSF